MALNLGQINFGISAETSGLQKAVANFQKFGLAVNQAARQTGKGAEQIAAAMRKQEAAVARALQQVLSYRQQVRALGADQGTNFLSSSTKAFQALVGQMTKGKLSALDYQRAMEQFQASMGRNQRGLRDWIAVNRQARNETSSFAQMIKKLQQVLILAAGPLSGIATRIGTLSTLLTTSTFAVGAFIAGLTAAGLAVTRFSQAIIQNELAIAQARGQLQGITGNMADAGAELNYVRGVADRSGQVFTELAKQWARFAAAAQGTSLQGDKAREIFEDIAMAAGQAQIGTVEFEGVMRALEQMLSKGNVQAEELRGQLGDRLPGAFGIAARAMGVTTTQLNDMLKAGQVGAEVFLPRFAQAMREAYGADGIERVDSLRASINRLNNSWSDFLTTADATLGVSAAYKTALEGLAGALNFLTRNFRDIIKWTTAVAAAVAGYFVPAMTAAVAPMIINGLASVAALIRGIATAVSSLNIAMAASSFFGKGGGVLKLLAQIAVAAGAAYLGFQAMDSLLGKLDQNTGNLIESNGKLATTYDEVSKKAQNAFANANRDIQELRQHTNLLMSGMGPATSMGIAVRDVQDLQLAISQMQDIQAFKQNLIDSGVSAEQAAAKTREYSDALRANNAAHREWEATTARSIELNREFSETFVRGIVDVFQGKTSMIDFLDTLLMKILEIVAIKPLIDALSESLNSLTEGGGGGSWGTAVSSFVSSLFAHTGAIVGGQGGTTRRVALSAFTQAPKYHTGGFAGDEVPAVLKRGEGIFTPKQMDNANKLFSAVSSLAASGGRGSTIVNVNISGVPEGYQADTTQSPNASGGTDIDIMITRVVAKGIRNPSSGISQALSSRGVGFQKAQT